MYHNPQGEKIQYTTWDVGNDYDITFMVCLDRVF